MPGDTFIDHEERKDKYLNKLLQLYCILLPFEEALASSIGSLQRILGFLIIGYVVITRHGKIVLRKEHYLLIIWLAYSILSFIWSSNKSNWEYFIQIYAVQIIFLLIIVGNDSSSIDLHGFRKAMIIGGIIAASMIVLLPQASYLTEEGRRTIIMFGRTLDPNIVAANMTMGIISSIGEYLEQDTRRYKSLYIVASGLILLGIFFTGSRGALIAMTISIFTLIFPELRNRNSSKWANRLLIIGTVVVIIILSVLPQELLLSRFSKDTILGLNEFRLGSHNRYTIWLYSLQVFKERFIAGYGCGNFINTLATVYRSTASHNLYILELVEGGIIGFGFLFSYLIITLKRISKMKDYIARAMLVFTMIMGLSLDSITYKYFWLILIYSAISILQIQSNEY